MIEIIIIHIFLQFKSHDVKIDYVLNFFKTSKKITSIQENNTELSELKLTKDKFFSLLEGKKPKYKINKTGCKLAIKYQNINEFHNSENFLKYCKLLGKQYSEIYYFLKIRTKFYQNDKNTINLINFFLKKYENSTFSKEAEKYKLRYYFKWKFYRKAYYGYLRYKKENKITHEQKLFIDYILRYSYLRIANSQNRLYALTEILKDKNFYLDSEIKNIKEEIKNYSLNEIETIFSRYLKNGKIEKIRKLLASLRKNFPDIFEKIVNSPKIKKILSSNPLTNFYLQMNQYIKNKNKFGFTENENNLNIMLKDFKKFEKDILIQKIYLYKKHKKYSQMIKTYQKLINLKISRKKKAYYTLKSAIYSFEANDKKNAIKYLNEIINKYRYYHREYTSALFLLFKYYRNKYLDNPKNEEILKQLEGIEKRMQKTHLKQVAYYFKFKDKRADEKEINTIKEYFKKYPFNFYSMLIFNKTDKTPYSYKRWKKLAVFTQIALPKHDKKITVEKSIYKLTKLFSKYKTEFPEIQTINQLLYIGETTLLDRIIINFYRKLNKLNRLRKSSKYDKQLKALKKIKKTYYFHILNYFIASNNIQYAYLILHRHFNNLKDDDFYKYFYHPFPYKETILKEAKYFNVNPLLILSVMETESIFNPTAYSSAGAIGLMQIMPQTGKAIARKLNIKNYNLYLPEYNIKFGTYYLSELLKRFKYQIPFSAASYNGGPHNMKRWLEKNKSRNLTIDEMINEIGFKESRNYAKKIIRLFSTYNKIYSDEDIVIPYTVNYDDKKTIDF